MSSLLCIALMSNEPPIIVCKRRQNKTPLRKWFSTARSRSDAEPAEANCKPRVLSTKAIIKSISSASSSGCVGTPVAKEPALTLADVAVLWFPLARLTSPAAMAPSEEEEVDGESTEPDTATPDVEARDNEDVLEAVAKDEVDGREEGPPIPCNIACKSSSSSIKVAISEVQCRRPPW